MLKQVPYLLLCIRLQFPLPLHLQKTNFHAEPRSDPPHLDGLHRRQTANDNLSLNLPTTLPSHRLAPPHPPNWKKRRRINALTSVHPDLPISLGNHRTISVRQCGWTKLQRQWKYLHALWLARRRALAVGRKEAREEIPQPERVRDERILCHLWAEHHSVLFFFPFSLQSAASNAGLWVHRLGRVWELDYSTIPVRRLFRHKASHSCFTVEAGNNQRKLEKSQL